ncbi:Metal-dependent hydrolase, beta-lactamase superfamily II [Atopostipes suicloacalis DSM 15692]|uniref:Metal-dependent hydrolase, beta-lactamase superfamily II n=1 Tax=Atopostipes suicloacalis DSM 15692 TaxID=1121025 RepID=A0A1M4SXD2_9LACT|nr:MBL fold metallo-hydrolase [Atopostipes suicloacalis]SHE36876.1 Metal-dependent hydrolase, beta-lactamase superfamily II [Atopostipes suicloacalis DSM 15692]
MAKRKRLTKKQRERRNRWVLGGLIAFFIFIGGYLTGRQDIDLRGIQAKLDETFVQLEEQIKNRTQPSKKSDVSGAGGTGQIHLFDVGQGSSTLYIASDGTSVLVDTGRYDDSEKRIISYLDQYIGLGEKIDLLVFSHNDSDHIGHGDLVLEYFDVQEVWMNGMDHTSKVYADLLDTLLEQDVEYVEPKAGERFNRGAFDLQILHPAPDSPQKDPNDESIIMRMVFDNLSVMTSGDASIPREKDVIKRNFHLKSDLLILGHHGAKNSSGEQWLEAVQPKMAFYQAGVNNSYGHPSPETLERLAAENIPVYGTDEFGTISLYIDEAGEITMETEK